MTCARNSGIGLGGFLLAAIGLLFSGVAMAAPGDHVFSQGFPSAGGIATSAPDGVVSGAGTFFGSVDFGGGTLTSMGMFTPDVFVAQWDASGSHEWSYGVTHNNGFGGATVEAIVRDASGNVYFGGRIHDGDIDFGGGSLTGPNLYVVKLDSAGAHVWSASYGDGTLTDLAVSSAGLAITGHTSASVDFGGGSIASAGASDAIVVLLNSSGGHIFSAGFGDAANNQAGVAVEIDALGNVAIAGGMQGTVDFGGGALVAAAANTFLASFDSTGTHRFSRVIAGSFSGGSSVFSVKPSLALGSVLAIAGEMRGAADFGGGALSSNGQGDIYIATYAADTGAHSWSANWGAATSESVNSLSINSLGHLVVTGTMLGAFDAGGGTLPYTSFTNLFMASYDAAGAHLFSEGYGGGITLGNSTDAAGDITLFGIANPGVDFGGGPLADAEFFFARLEGSGPGAPAHVPGLGLLGGIGLASLLGVSGIRRSSLR